MQSERHAEEGQHPILNAWIVERLVLWLAFEPRVDSGGNEQGEGCGRVSRVKGVAMSRVKGVAE